MHGLSHTYRYGPRRDEGCYRDLGEQEWGLRVAVLLISCDGLGGLRNMAILASVSPLVDVWTRSFA